MAAKHVIKEESVPEEQIGITSAAEVVENTEVDVVGWTDKDVDASNEIEDPDATEYSSSFADTISDAENGSEGNDDEVQSELFGENGMACPQDPFGPDVPTRKRKLVTNDWQNFIRPLSWRMKWTEIRLKQLESQEFKCRKELEKYDREKHKATDHFNLEEFGSRSVPFSSQQYRSKAKVRRKRKKIEDTTDVATYTKHHPLFSYLENKKSDADGSSDEESDNPELNEDSTENFGEDVPVLKCTDADIFFEELFTNIDELQDRIDTMLDLIDSIRSTDDSTSSVGEDISDSNESTCTHSNFV